MIQNSWQSKYNIATLEMKTFQEHHDFYLDTHAHGLADVFENFRKTSFGIL